ncbi:unnamed protein product [Lactuca virosa]|uniref:Uncharacterized protein n=1 Tax=Lactuca virosa TaxID=75947 RepID=A0AAU9PB35_9ASTR|nr:unnamed protein product [Lactuca virosa]
MNSLLDVERHFTTNYYKVIFFFDFLQQEAQLKVVPGLEMLNQHMSRCLYYSSSSKGSYSQVKDQILLSKVNPNMSEHFLVVNKRFEASIRI